MKLRIVHPFLLLGIAALGGCATITRGTTEAWTVETDPPNAEIELSTGERCLSPCTLQKKRKETFMVSIRQECYRPV